MIYKTLIETVGKTPLVKLNSISTKDVSFYAKLESFNPGGSSKDRIAQEMINAAEKSGELKEGGTIIEATSGNTGLALALIGIQKKYNVVLIVPDKMSAPKITLLESIGARVIICPTEVEPDDPESYYSVAKKLSKEIPNSYWVKQYWNPNNPIAHYKKTGPEIWKETEGKITHFFAGTGTGGTISGTGKFLKEKNENVKIISPDPKGSILAHYHKNRNLDVEAHSYKIEGVGEDIIPETVNFEVIDDFITITDKEAYYWTRKIALDEGLIMGSSSGMVVAGALKYNNFPAGSMVVMVFPDTGERYTNKIYNNRWMRFNDFMEPVKTVKQILTSKPSIFHLVKSISEEDTVTQLVEKFKKFETVSQIVITSVNSNEHKSITRNNLYRQLINKEIILEDKIITMKCLNQTGRIQLNASIEEAKQKISATGILLVFDNKKMVGLLTLSDIFENSERNY